MKELLELCELLKYGISISRASANVNYCIFVHISETEVIHEWGRTVDDACIFALTALREKHDEQLKLLF